MLDSGRFYNRSSKPGDAIHTPLRENQLEGRDLIVLPRSAWQLFKTLYSGKDIIRFSIVKNRLGFLFRPLNVPLIRLCVMRRGDQIRLPKYIPIQFRTTLEQFKRQLLLIFTQITSDWGCDPNYLDQDLHAWLLTTEMPTNDFIESFNRDISSNFDQ